MSTRLRTTAIVAAECYGILLLVWAVASRVARAMPGAPVGTAVLAVAATGTAVVVGRWLWLATVPATTATARAVRPTLLGAARRVAGHGRSPATELLGALVSPLALALASGAFALAAWHAGGVSPAVAAALEGVAGVLFLLAAVTLAPGLPFDGGRILRAITWWWTGDVASATRFASSAGQGLATLTIIAGAGSGLAGGFMAGAVLITAGLVMHLATAEGYEAVELVEDARGLRVRDAMHPAVCTLGRGTSMAEALERYEVMGGAPVFPVLDGRTLAGIVSCEQALRTPPAHRPETTAEQVMTPTGDLAVAHPDAWLSHTLGWQARARGYIPVATDGRLTGVVLTDGRWPVQAQSAPEHIRPAA